MSLTSDREFVRPTPAVGSGPSGSSSPVNPENPRRGSMARHTGVGTVNERQTMTWDSSVVPTKYWHVTDNERIQCDLCPRACRLHEGQRGLCFLRGRLENQVVLAGYGHSSGFCVDPVEKKPLNHFLPGSAVSRAPSGVLLPHRRRQHRPEGVQRRLLPSGLRWSSRSRLGHPVLPPSGDLGLVGGDDVADTGPARL